MSAECRVPSAGCAGDGACWRFVVARVWELTGMRLPEEFAAALAATAAIADEVPTGLSCRTGDILWCRGGPGEPDHVAVCVDAFSAEHLHRGERQLVRIDALRKVGAVRKVLRPRPWMNGEKSE